MVFKIAVLRCAKSACGVKLLSKRGIRTGSEWWNAEVESEKLGVPEMTAYCIVKVEKRMRGIKV